MSKINFFSLGGLDEQEKACYVLEVNDNYYIFNLGITIPVYTKLGIKKIIPYVDWIEKNSRLIKGIFIGNASHRNMGAIQYVYDKIKNIPIYTSKIGELIINSYLNKKSMHKFANFTDLNIKVLDPLKTVDMGNVKITPFRVVSCLPDTYGFIIGTPDGNIIYIDEFIINADRNNAFISDITKINMITRGKNLLLINNVGNVAKNSGFTSPNHRTKSFYTNLLNNCTENRVIVSCYDTDIHTFLTLAQIAKEKQIPFIIYNPIFMNVFNGISREGYFDNRNLPIMPIHKINEMKRGIVLLSSTPDRLFNKLISISNNEDDILKLKKTDLVVLGFKTSAGFEKIEADIMDRYSKLDLDIVSLPKTVLKMEASAEDHKFLISELQPKYVIPTLGLYSEVIKYTNCIKEAGFNPNNVQMLYNGEIFSLVNGIKKDKETRKIDVREIYVGAQGILDEGENILQERGVMSENGIVFIVLQHDSANKCFDPNNHDIKHFGVVPEDQKNLEWFKSLNLEILDFANKTYKEIKKYDSKEFKSLIKKYASKQIEKYFGKTPIVIPTII